MALIATDQKSQWKIRCFLNSDSWRYLDARYAVAVVCHQQCRAPPGQVHSVVEFTRDAQRLAKLPWTAADSRSGRPLNQPVTGMMINASTCLRMLANDPPDIDGARETARRIFATATGRPR
ncbi:MAG TPA: hypothetical protein VHX13_04445 [Acidobacteriaceae bacterium]|nr:hypothetical protein [Acidobacteriaceae bacterium]